MRKTAAYFSSLARLPKVLLLAACCCVLPVDCDAQKKDSAQEQLVDLSELSIDETLMLPDVPEKQAPYIKSYMHREAQALQKMGYKVETMRQGEVVIATIPADELFAPNDTTLLPGAADLLKPFLPYFRTHGKFKVILAMHSDDTGSSDYLYGLTERRVVSLYDYFDRYAAQTDMLQGYPMADSDPLRNTPNTTADGRRANRRLEIFIVPGPMLIMDAKSKKI
ncbi:MAG: OmpA family protein [Muribaculaceae bacterium]|nr:OmpA family protein [Muribaculaceae bacterium]